VPIIGGLYVDRADRRAALWSIAAGLVTLFVVRALVVSRYPAVDPVLTGLAAASLAFAIVVFTRRVPAHVGSVQAR
jgi:Na+/pantothenate symporter